MDSLRYSGWSAVQYLDLAWSWAHRIQLPLLMGLGAKIKGMGHHTLLPGTLKWLSGTRNSPSLNGVEILPFMGAWLVVFVREMSEPLVLLQANWEAKGWRLETQEMWDPEDNYLPLKKLNTMLSVLGILGTFQVRSPLSYTGSQSLLLFISKHTLPEILHPLLSARELQCLLVC